MRYVRIYEVNHLQSLEIIKLELNRNGIQYFIENENSLTLGSAYVLGLAGAIISVEESQVEDAISVLEEFGLQVSYGKESHQFSFVKKVDGWIKGICLYFQN